MPVHSSVIKTDFSDHYFIELSLTTATDIKIITKRIFTNKIKFTNRLSAAKWDPLYLITDANHAFNYFIKKIKRIYNKSFPFKTPSWQPKKNPWMTTRILKSVRYKNALFLKCKSNPNLKNEYKIYRNCLTNVIREAKCNYHK